LRARSLSLSLSLLLALFRFLSLSLSVALSLSLAVLLSRSLALSLSLFFLSLSLCVALSLALSLFRSLVRGCTRAYLDEYRTFPHYSRISRRVSHISISRRVSHISTLFSRTSTLVFAYSLFLSFTQIRILSHPPPPHTHTP